MLQCHRCMKAIDGSQKILDPGGEREDGHANLVASKLFEHTHCYSKVDTPKLWADSTTCLIRIVLVSLTECCSRQIFQSGSSTSSSCSSLSWYTGLEILRWYMPLISPMVDRYDKVSVPSKLWGNLSNWYESANSIGISHCHCTLNQKLRAQTSGNTDNAINPESRRLGGQTINSRCYRNHKLW